jgi:hypothetical protein
MKKKLKPRPVKMSISLSPTDFDAVYSRGVWDDNLVFYLRTFPEEQRDEVAQIYILGALVEAEDDNERWD